MELNIIKIKFIGKKKLHELNFVNIEFYLDFFFSLFGISHIRPLAMATSTLISENLIFQTLSSIQNSILVLSRSKTRLPP